MRIYHELSLLLIISGVVGKVIGPFPEGVPGSGYGCGRPCDTEADVHYTIEAVIRTYEIPGTENSASFNHTRSKVKLRTFVGDANVSSKFCDGDDDGRSGPLGPCLSVNPGQRLKIKLVNKLNGGMETLHQHPVTLSEYWESAVEEGRPNLDAIPWVGETPKRPEDLKITNEQDLPGWTASFDDINLHLHGLQVVPHLFYPQGTGNATAEWITISATDREKRCYCYVFDLPKDHPQGTFFWHIHRHGSTTMQGWQGMMGMLIVGEHDGVDSPGRELAAQGIKREEKLLLWEMAVSDKEKGGSVYAEGQFLDNDRELIFITNNEYQPNLTMCVNETVHFRMICGQTTSGSAIYVLDENDTVIPVFVFASDGISYGKAVEKSMIVVGPGQREALLLQFDRPGKYRIMQLIIEDFQGPGEAEKQNEPAAFVIVESPSPLASCRAQDGVDLSSLKFTPGIRDSIEDKDIDRYFTVNFEVQSDLNKAPMPQFVVDGEPFDINKNHHILVAETCAEWTVISSANYFHPYHIHVNPFQVKQTFSGFLPGEVAGIELLDAVVDSSTRPKNMWRDTVFIPPFGQTKVYQRFGGRNQSFAGRSALHCHYLDHEDAGMMAAFVIVNSSIPSTNTMFTSKRSIVAWSSAVAVIATIGLLSMFYQCHRYRYGVKATYRPI